MRHNGGWRRGCAVWLLGGVILGGMAPGSATLTNAAESPRQNVLLIVLDDAGYSDVAGFGRDDAPTTNLRALADQGVRFTRHYADSTCRPARFALLTGRETARVVQNPDFRGIPPELLTLPEALRAQGYRTLHLGKWHLGDSERNAWPDRQGFDHWFGYLNQFQLKGPDAHGQFTKRPTYTNPYLQSDALPLQQYQGHLEDLISDQVLAAIEDGAKHPAPWFINWWLFAPHHPSTASPAWLKRFPDTPAGKYQALLAQADDNIGKAIARLRQTGQLDHTLIIVVSDNGGTNQMMNNNAPYAGIKGGFEEGSLRTPLLIRWPDQRHAGEQQAATVAIQDIFPTVMDSLGLPVPAGLDGQSVLPLLAGQPLLPRRLTHEIVAPGAYDFSVLSEDGHWRLTHGALYDLQQHPQGDTDVAAAQPAQRQALLAAYWAWRNAKLPVPLTTTREAVGWRVTGSPFLRAPGYGAYSAALGLLAPTGSGTVLQQDGVWSLQWLPDRRLRVQVGSLTATSSPVPTVAPGHCLPVVFTSYFSRSRLHEGKNAGRFQVYAAGRRVLEYVFDNPAEITGDLTAPTRVGTAGLPFSVGAPLLFTAELMPVDTDGPETTVAQAGELACQSLAAAAGDNK